MIVATSLILPAALWMGGRVVSTIDEISKKIDAMKEASIEQAVEARAQAHRGDRAGCRRRVVWPHHVDEIRGGPNARAMACAFRQ